MAIVECYPLISLEDGLGADNWEGWQSLQQWPRDRLQLAGDHLLVSNIKGPKAMDMRAANVFLIKASLGATGGLTDVTAQG